MIDTLIFDFDGVIIDTETPDYETWQQMFRTHGVSLERSLWTQFIGKSSGEFDPCQQLEELTGKQIDRNELLLQRRRIYLDAIDASPLLPGIIDYIQDAKAIGLNVGIASSSPVSWVEGHLAARGILESFDSISGKDHVPQVKPEPDLYLLAASRMGTKPEHSLAIEDSAHGITAAKRAGMFCVVVPNSMTKDLPIGHADLRLESLADMELKRLLALADV